MATHGWRTGRTLKDQLIEEGNSFNYFQLMHLLDLAKSKSQLTEAANETNTDEDSSDENSSEEKSSDEKAGQGPSLNWKILADLEAAFPVSEIRSIELEKAPTAFFNNKGAPEQTVIARTSNYCIAGHQGPLPENYTDWIREQQRYGPSAMAAFLDIFNHRINMLRYEVKRDSCLPLESRRPDEGLLAPGLSAAMGMLGENLFEQLPLSKRSILSLSGLMSGRRISARAIQRILQKCFDIKTRITDVLGVWRDVAPDQFWRLGQEGVSNLGSLCILGQKSMDMQGRIRIELGPLHIDKYLALLPDLKFSAEKIEVPVRSKKDITRQTYRGKHLSYAYADSQTTNPGFKQSNEKDVYQVENIRLVVEPEHSKQNMMLPSDFKLKTKNRMRATKFSGYLYRPFSALVTYLTNSKVDAEVILEVDPDSLPEAYPVLCTPERPQDAYLRLGQSFWLGRPNTEEHSRASFIIDGFEHAAGAVPSASGVNYVAAGAAP